MRGSVVCRAFALPCMLSALQGPRGSRDIVPGTMSGSELYFLFHGRRRHGSLEGSTSELGNLPRVAHAGLAALKPVRSTPRPVLLRCKIQNAAMQTNWLRWHLVYIDWRQTTRRRPAASKERGLKCPRLLLSDSRPPP